MALELQFTESLPPYHVGKVDVEWNKVLPGHQHKRVDGPLEACVEAYPELEPVFEMTHHDAASYFGSGNLTHNVRIHTGAYATSFLGEIRNTLGPEVLKKPYKESFVSPRGSLHLDVDYEPDSLDYTVSSLVSTEYALGRFLTAGSTDLLWGRTLTPLLLAFQARRAPIVQPDAGEVVRGNSETVHRSPRRIVMPGVHHVFVADSVRLAR